MLAKKFRLTHHEFLLAKNGGKSWRNADLSVVVTANKLSFNRFAVVTSTKLSKSAVVRNKLRRQMYDVLGKKMLGGHDFLIFPRGSMLNLDNATLSAKIDSLLSTIPKLS